MNRIIAALTLMCLLMTGAGRAEGVMAELRGMRKSAGDRILELEPPPTPAPEAATEPTPTPDATWPPLSSGMKGDAVREMQQRLIDLGHLTGRADGSYGARTAAAVKAFQQSAGLKPTGEADAETLRALFMTSPVRVDYQKFNYDMATEEPENYAGMPVTLAGSVLQVLMSDEDADSRGVYTALRVATKGEYDRVVYVALFRPAAAEPIGEGDRVRVTGMASGLYTYTTETGDEIALPRVEGEDIQLE